MAVAENAIRQRTALVIVGPTASGKTPISLRLAGELNGEIVSADSRQIYKYMTIGTAKPSPEELASVKHYFIDTLTPDVEYNASEYSKQARDVIDSIFERGKLPIIVGGSGLYIQALIDGFFEGPSADKELRTKLEERLENEGGAVLLEELRAVDPVAASSMHPSNKKRIVRALEVYRLTGTPISEFQKENIPANFSACFVALQWERNILYDAINSRVERMFQQGLVDEVKSLLDMGYPATLNALQTVGYREIIQHWEGKHSLETAKELIKRNSRRYAKRQLTWFRADERIRWFEFSPQTDVSGVIESIKQHLSESLL